MFFLPYYPKWKRYAYNEETNAVHIFPRYCTCLGLPNRLFLNCKLALTSSHTENLLATGFRPCSNITATRIKSSSGKFPAAPATLRTVVSPVSTRRNIFSPRRIFLWFYTRVEFHNLEVRFRVLQNQKDCQGLERRCSWSFRLNSPFSVDSEARSWYSKVRRQRERLVSLSVFMAGGLFATVSALRVVSWFRLWSLLYLGSIKQLSIRPQEIWWWTRAPHSARRGLKL